MRCIISVQEPDMPLLPRHNIPLQDSGQAPCHPGAQTCGSQVCPHQRGEVPLLGGEAAHQGHPHHLCGQGEGEERGVGEQGGG